MTALDGRRFDYPPTERDSIRRTLSQALAAEPDVAFAFIHGSFPTQLPFHDIDIAVYMVGLDTSQISRRTRDIAESLVSAAFAFHTNHPCPPIDVRALNAAPLGFCYQVLRNGNLLSTRDDAFRTDWTATTISRYLDIKPLHETALKEAMSAWHST